MSRVQKKPIRRRLKDAAGKAEDPKSFEPSEPVNAAPAEDTPKSRIPRKPKPEVAAKPEADAPAKRVVRRTARSAPDAAEEQPEERPRRAPASAERSDRRSDRGENSRNGDRNGRSNDRDGRSNYGNGDRGSRDGRGRDRDGGRDRNGGRNDRNGRGGFGGRKPAEKKKRPEKIVYEKTKQFVFPGEIVGAIEEYKPGFGTVNDDGTIRATVSGVIGVNKEHRMITVIPKTKTLNMITEGDIVIASITDVRESNARVDIVAAEKSLGEEIVNKGNAEIYVSNIKDGFAKSVAEEFSVGDIVRAKVIDSKKIGLSTVEPELGVLKAYCSKCKTSLTKSDEGLVCGNCGNRERRKLAEGYGKGISSAP
ncbi:exosome complex RNA-binding protein Csl4 [Methanimicrococcus blatticola]|uniref:Exosome complex component Csl4 n=1 Tax=Methanimicrococcus blatticola TaxID=91560 RepID=A0A484F6Q1_9EURY|nr:exosome complex RNA-binding protein Csl4 [Methanimicrococcus blatticola]MBZ3935760.1 exosome complex RNA-binding protein Csl4 [Methanimicrococcus blatticola]MCC2508120.1 exosome complex RNA-binding protein Csl4 [Methanimicrococcus blatticola]TDQ68801.1 exosome complex component CSL4 [Methanimicrococcus blatticola]